MNLGKSILAAIVCMLCLLTGCTQVSDTNGKTHTPTGLFVQAEISPDPQTNFYSDTLTQWADGTIAFSFVDETNTPRVFTGDGQGEWVEHTNAPALAHYNQIQRETGSAPWFTVSDDLSWWFTTTSKDRQPQLSCVGSNGSIQHFTLNLPASNGQEMRIGKLAPSNNGAVAVLLTEDWSENGAAAYWLLADAEIGQHSQYVALEQSAAYQAVVGGRNLYVPQSNGILHTYSLENGTLEESRSIPQLNFSTENILFTIAENDDFCYTTGSGIHRMAAESSIVQDVVTGTQYVFSDVQYRGFSMLALQDGSYLLTAYTAGSNKLYHIAFDENAISGDMVTLSLWAMEETHILRAAISVFSLNNPGVLLQPEYGRVSGDRTLSEDDILRALNTRIVAGDVPDILILDGLPIDAYISQGILLDLSGKVDLSGCYNNIMDAFVRDGKAYAYPALFQMPVLVGSAGDALLTQPLTLQTLAALAETPNQLFFGDYQEMLEALYLPYSNHIFPASSAVDEKELESFLLYTKRIADALDLTEENKYMHGGMGTEGIYPRQGIAKYMENGTDYAADILWDPVQMVTLFNLRGEQTIVPLPGESYIPVCAAAITASSSYQEQALAFIQTMLTDDAIQSLQMEQGFSVTKGRHLAYYESRRSDETSNPAEYDWDALTDSFTGGPANTEAVLQEKFFTVAIPFYKGETSLESTVELILKNTRLYFEERQ